MSQVLGIDIGGSGMKAAPVDTTTGELVGERHRIPTPDPATPEAMIDVGRQLVDHFSWKKSVGCAFPGVIQQGRVLTAANLDKAWVGVDGAAAFTKALDLDVAMVNDADAAGLAEVRFGAAKDVPGVVLMVTLGTGIGTGMFVDGKLVPNTELGHLKMDGKTEAEDVASARAREDAGLSWADWSGHLDAYLCELERLLWPTLFVLGGGVSKKFDKFADRLTVRTPIVAAEMRNQAGIVGAALAT